jgi:hypothetical protein
MIRLLVVSLTVLFVGLKLTAAVFWSWWWVLSPLLCFIGVLGFALMLLGLAKYLEESP